MGQIQDNKSLEKGRLQGQVRRLQDESYDLKKHVATIHSSNKLTLVQRKIANALLFNAYRGLLTESEFTIHIAELCHLIGYNSHEHRAIKNALVSLISTVIEWNLVDKEKLNSEEQWNASAIISDASIKGAVCTYSYSNRMRQLLHSPDRYGRVNMKTQARFKSSYGLALYENCIRYQTVRETPWLDILVFRKLMGVSEAKYAAFKDFRKRVIEIAVKEVNEYTSFDVDYILRKVGRKVVAVKFTIVKQAMIPKEEAALPIIDQMHKEFGFSLQQANEALSHYGETYIKEKITIVTNSASFQQGSIANLANYLHSALQQDYQSVKSSHAAVSQGLDLKSKQKREESQQAKQRQHYEKYCRTQLLNHFDTLPTQTQADLLAQFQQTIEGSFYLPLFLKDGIRNAVVESRFLSFMGEANLKPTNLESFEDYVSREPSHH
jgi:plasmid replication initiation protein